MKIFNVLLVLLLSCNFLNAQASSAKEPTAAKAGFGYHALEPDIITNYLGDGKTLGYIRVTVQLMAENHDNLKLLEQHDPLIRDAIIHLIGSKTGEQIKSLVNREALRKECETRVNELLQKETGRKAVHELIFTKFLYQ